MKQYRFLISTNTLKDITLIENNVESNKLTIMINRVQDLYLEPILGTPLFKKLLDDVENNDISGIYQTLVENYIYDFIGVCCELEYMVEGNNKVMNSGVGQINPDNINVNSRSENNVAYDNKMKHKARYQNRLVGFLKDNEDDLPEYKERNCNHEDIVPNEEKTTAPSFNLVTRKKYV